MKIEIQHVGSRLGATGGTGWLIRDLMVESIERRFGDRALPHPVQWLSDNGRCYRFDRGNSRPQVDRLYANFSLNEQPANQSVFDTCRAC
jgi:hypothetical protein